MVDIIQLYFPTSYPDLDYPYQSFLI